MAFPESALVRRTFTFKEMDLPPNVRLTKRSLLRWFALSFGLISEKESRTTMLDVLDALFYYQFTKKMNPSTIDLQAYILEKSQEKVSDKLLRYHLKRLIDVHFLKRTKQRYHFNHSPVHEKDDIQAAFSHYITAAAQQNCTRIEEVLGHLKESYTG